MIEHHKGVYDVSDFEPPALLPDWEACFHFPVVEVDGCWLWTTGTEWHDDDGGPWSALLIVRNDGIRVEDHEGGVEPQPGDLIILNISEEHRALALKARASMLCLFTDYEVRLTAPEALRLLIAATV